MQRTPAQLREQYEIERELADRLRRATRAERGQLYAKVYDELFRRVPHHPQWTKQGTDDHRITLASQIRLLRRHLNSEVAFLEVGAGDCALCREIAPSTKQVYAVEVSGELVRDVDLPKNLQLLIFDGCRIPLPDATIDLAYTHQVMEHIHPDDAQDQLREIYRVLKPGGLYCCITPNRLSGPHDISALYDREATGLHLKEYSVRDLTALFRQVGFRQVWIERRVRGLLLRYPIVPVVLLERALQIIPWQLRTPLARTYVLSRLLDSPLFGRK
jgi:SAM-dependent methyltransferase